MTPGPDRNGNHFGLHPIAGSRCCNQMPESGAPGGVCAIRGLPMRSQVATAKKPQQMRGKSHRTPVASKIDPAANTDTPSAVSVAVSQGRYRFATHSATDVRVRSAGTALNSEPGREGGGGQQDGGRQNRKSNSARAKFSTNARLASDRSEVRGKWLGCLSSRTQRIAKKAAPQ
jgi:hypothetical protein